MSLFTENSALIVAHPDDEILWFSSVLEKVSSIVLCYVDSPYESDLAEARREVIRHYPLNNMVSLDVCEAGSFDAVDWSITPNKTEYGITIANPAVEVRYEKSYRELCERLRPLLCNFKNIITHNPWGEYGHPDHVQVYRVVKFLQSEFQYDIWYSNCCANRSAGLALETISGLNGRCEVLPTNDALVDQFMSLYQKYGAWTWYDDFEWFEEDVFISDASYEDESRSHGKMKLNMLSLDLPITPAQPVQKRPVKWIDKIFRRLNNPIRTSRSDV